MLRQLVAAFGSFDAAAAFIGLPDRDLQGWLLPGGGSDRHMTYAARRVIWLMWSLTFKPQNVRDVFTVATWGKFLPDDVAAGSDVLRRSFLESLAGRDWSDWSI